MRRLEIVNKQQPMIAAIYARVSTADQNCEMQLRELREYATRRDWRIVDEYVDTGWSGAKASRPELDRLMKDASLHKFDCVLVWKIDRFGRSVLNLVEGLQRLRSYGVRFLAVTQSIDTDQANPTSQLMLHILAAVAEFEREMIRERVKAGMKAAKHRGKACCRPRIEVDLARVQRLNKAGQSVRAIASLLGVSRSVIGRTLVSLKADEANAILRRQRIDSTLR